MQSQRMRVPDHHILNGKLAYSLITDKHKALHVEMRYLPTIGLSNMLANFFCRLMMNAFFAVISGKSTSKYLNCVFTSTEIIPA